MYGGKFIEDLVRAIPRSALAKVFTAYLASGLSTFPFHSPPENDDEDASKDESKISPDEILEDMIVYLNPKMQLTRKEAYNMNTSCITTGRILASYYLYIKEYEAASETAQSAMEALRKLRTETGLLITATETVLLVVLATSLIYYQSPKHHPQAQKLFDIILSRKPQSIEALVGEARIALQAGELQRAVQYSSKAIEIGPHNVEAKMEHAWALVLSNDVEKGKRELEEILPLIDARDPHSRATVAEIWWRIGKCHWHEGTLFRLSEINEYRFEINE